eukprot:CAMPEP_0201572428 /NCGR_PEP_ID=MMETSP0190_2-20130828/15681_1 /ASSEMBLY_ACC=CAM_ASM_000263 /TAXON_ID=37353 /ORGANISM="Rosalina sp." /LENGTH=719 /DNA_ID=CAMNT_0047998167 /DNA_START=25 /DNA_END=2184 /DNA_ORIENTATION=+
MADDNKDEHKDNNNDQYCLRDTHFKILHVSNHDQYSPTEQVLNEALQLTNKDYELQTLKDRSKLPDDLFDNFDTILLSVWSSIDVQKLGNLLANAVDQGKHVVILLFSNATSYTYPQGRFVTEKYNAITRVPTQSIKGTLGKKYQPNHPIMNGINELTVGTEARRAMGTIPEGEEESIDRIADWDNGNVLIAIRHNKPGLITEITCSFGTNGAIKDAKKLLNNALRLDRRKHPAINADVLRICPSKLWKLFAEDLGNQLNTDELNDVTFTFNEIKENVDVNASNATAVKANRGLLSLLSPVFRKMFQNQKISTVAIKDSDSKSFKLFIQYFYGMDPQITASNVGAISYLAQHYSVKGLQKMCDLFLKESISIDNVVSILESLHSCHQESSKQQFFEKCKGWMTAQTSIESIVTLFESETFIHTHHEIVNVLLSGFGTRMDATTLWKCVSKWSETKSTRYSVVTNSYAIHEEDAKEGTEVTQVTSIKYSKWLTIREQFPFHRLPINVLSTSVLPLNILTKEMALRVLSHKTFGHESALVNYCISDNPAPFSATDQFLPHNLDKYDISLQDYELRVKAKTASPIYGKCPMRSGNIYEWTVRIIEFQNAWIGFGMDVVNDDRKANDAFPGRFTKNSYGIYTQNSQMQCRFNNKNLNTISQGTSNGLTITFRYDSTRGTLNVFANETQNYTFTDINVNETYHPSFRTAPTTTWTIKYLSRPFI